MELYFGLRALRLTSHPGATTKPSDQSCENAHRLYDSPSKPHFRFYDLPSELQIQILEDYVSTLYPRIVHRCLCCLCEPIPNTTLLSKRALIYQINLHRSRDFQTPYAKDAAVRRRFSYCEDLPVNSNIRTFDHGRGRDFDFPYGTGPRPAEPGIFLASKRLRQDAIDVLVKTRPFYVFSQDPACNYYASSCSDRCRDLLRLPLWYRKSLRFAEELRPDVKTISSLCRNWPIKLFTLRELRLNYGRVKMNTKMKCSREKLEWMQGVPETLLEAMVRRRVWVMMRKICIWAAPDDGEKNQDLWLDQSKIPGLNNWDNLSLNVSPFGRGSPLERNWKVVLLVEFRIRVRENEHPKRQWASIVSGGQLQ